MKTPLFAAACPECGAGVGFKALPRLGQPVTCPGCHVPLEVIGLRPIELELSADAALRPHKRAGKPAKGERRGSHRDYDR